MRFGQIAESSPRHHVISFQVIYFYIGRAGNGRGTSTRTGWGASQIRNAARSRTAGREHRRQGKMRAGNHRETLLQRNDVVRNVLEMLLWRLASRLYAHDPARYWNYQYPSFIGSSTMSAIAISRLPRGCASQYPPPRRAPGPSGHRQPESPWSTHQIPRSG